MFKYLKRRLAEDITVGNELLTHLIKSDIFINRAKNLIESDHQFFYDHIEKYQMIIVPDDQDNDSKREPEHGSILGIGYFIEHVNSLDDIYHHMMHALCHARCDTLWIRCRFPMETFSFSILDFVEEMYNQRLIEVIAPTLYDGFPKALTAMEKHYGTITDYRSQVQTIFTREPTLDIKSVLLIHTWLYQVDPMQDTTFELYMRMWKQMIDTDPKVQQLIKNYICDYN